MRNRFAAVAAIVVFLAMITLPTALNLAGVKSPDGLLNEKRRLADFPTAFSNHIFADLETWYRDHAPYRLLMIDRQKKVAQAYGTPYRRHVHPFLSEVFTPDWYREYSAARGDDAPFLAPLKENQALYGRSDWLFLATRKCLANYTRSDLPDDAQLSAWKDDFLALKAACDARGIRLLIAIAPNKEQVYPEYMPSYLVQDNARRVEYIADYMRRQGIPYIEILPELLAAKGDRELYHRQDTHWNSLGGFTGAMAILRELGMPACAPEDVAVETYSKTGGDLSNFVGFRTTYDAYTVEYKPEVEVSVENYGIEKHKLYTSNAGNDHRLILVGDSFQEACRPFLAKDFRSVLALRYKGLDKEGVAEAVQGLSEGDVLLLLSIERYDTTCPETARTLTRLLS